MPTPHTKSTDESAEYGVLRARNIDKVVFGAQEFDTWYGNGAYFHNPGDTLLGIDPQAVAARRRAHLPLAKGFWLDRLFVCEFCFKYAAEEDLMALHRVLCPLNRAFPPLGLVVYADMKTPYIIKRLSGYRNRLFCQNLSLFGKLFLDDKLVFYNVDAFEFYVVYGHAKDSSFFRPMGFFSKELNCGEPDINLACVCVFPPFQRLRLGSLLIEFLYELARVTPGQRRLGPEYPLSPFGRALYLRFWAKRLAFVLSNDIKSEASVTLDTLALRTGFRKDDILLTLEHMGVLLCDSSGRVVLALDEVASWCRQHHVDERVLASMLDPEGLYI